MRSVVYQVCDILKDDACLRELGTLAVTDAAAAFGRLRDHYRLRSEFNHFVVELPPEQWELQRTMASLGFEVSVSPE